MSSFISLEAVLEGRFETPFDELPEDLRKRVERGFRPSPWNSLTPDDRRKRAYHWDCLHDPAIEDEQRRLWGLGLLMDDLKEEIEEWEATPAKDVDQRLKKERRLEKLKTELQEVTDAFWGEAGSSASSRNAKLQDAAAKLAEHLKKEGVKHFTKRQIARKLSESKEWIHMKDSTIERLIHKDW